MVTAQILESGDQSNLAEADRAIQEEDHLGVLVRFEEEKAVMLDPAQRSVATDCLLKTLVEKVAHRPILVEGGLSILAVGHLAPMTAIEPPGEVVR